jgi:diaminopimelate decarboxylase
MLAKLGSGFDIVSGGELQRVRAANRASVKQVVFSGVGKLREEIDLALQAGILLFNVESASELAMLSARATHLRKKASFAVRVNPDVEAKTHPYISTGLHQHKFGVPLHSAAELYRLGSSNSRLRAAGVSAHIGSQITDVAPFAEAMTRVAEFTAGLRAEGHQIRYVDAGGGLGISYHGASTEDFKTQASAYATALLAPLKRLGVHLLLEPGRSIIGPAGVLLTRVVYRKRNDGKEFLVVDAAMNDLIRPSLYGVHHEIVPSTLRTEPAKLETVDVVGPVCETGDFFARGRELPRAEEGELLVILDAGAYGMALASNYNTRPRAAEVLVDGRKSRLIRRRESMAELLAAER